MNLNVCYWLFFLICVCFHACLVCSCEKPHVPHLTITITCMHEMRAGKSKLPIEPNRHARAVLPVMPLSLPSNP